MSDYCGAVLAWSVPLSAAIFAGDEAAAMIMFIVLGLITFYGRSRS